MTNDDDDRIAYIYDAVGNIQSVVTYGEGAVDGVIDYPKNEMYYTYFDINGGGSEFSLTCECEEGDSNPHAEALDPKSSVSASSTILAGKIFLDDSHK